MTAILLNELLENTSSDNKKHGSGNPIVYEKRLRIKILTVFQVVKAFDNDIHSDNIETD